MITKTTDFAIATFALCKGLHIQKIQKKSSSIFIFKENLEPIIKDYWSNEPIGVLDYTEKERALKRRLFN